MAPEFWCQTNATEFWCHSISGAKLPFTDVTPLFEFGTRSLAPGLLVGFLGCENYITYWKKRIRSNLL